MNTLNTKIAAAALLAFGAAGLSAPAMADEHLTAKNQEFHDVAAGKYDAPRAPDAQSYLPANAAPMSFERSVNSYAAPAGSLAPVRGPFSDSNPHSGPAHNS
ncbi:hypothetical protein ACLBXM_01545 [Xanthobacteraceae bacterium A53D]